jgi:hypothetical protein
MSPDAPDQEHLALLTAIGRALGQDTPYEELHGDRQEAISLGTMQSPPASASREVLGGAVSLETGRVAWLEEQSDPPQGGHVPVSIDLHVAWGGQRASSLEVPTYNPYFGCRVRYMRWYGEALIVIYREKHRMIAARLDPPYREWNMVLLQDRCFVDADTVYFASERAQLLEGRLLPSLAPALPFPPPKPLRDKNLWQPAPGRLALVRVVRVTEAEGRANYQALLAAVRAATPSFALPPPEARALIVAPERLRARLQELLAPAQPPEFGVDVLVGSVATPFWSPEQPRGTRYQDIGRITSSPQYLAVYWHQHLVAEGRAAEALRWRKWLEQVAALDGVEPEPWLRSHRGEELVARTALRYLRTRAKTLAKVCHTGKLPEGEGCNFFSHRGNAQRLEGDASYPPGFREVLRQVASHNPKPLGGS